MKLHSLIPSRMALTVACGIAFAAGIGTFQAKGDAWDKKTILTVNQTIQVRDTVLEPGQYVLKLYNSNSERHIVQIFNADQSHLINTVMAIPKQRMEPTGDTQFQFWETPSGTARAMRAWFYPGDTIGQEFPYPKHLIALASAAPVPVPTPVTTEPEPAPAPQPETQPQAATHDQDVPDQPAENQPVETTPEPPPPPAPAATEPAPTPPPPQELPKTGSPYPVLGISGGILLGIYGLLRLKRMA
ncbi:MAG TPA: LPXTG cell wall anchor domain-containing protein [Candidatus Acidoferrales bacterium]|nr:LPXTG cell wall anchor domain-containing protein [Candidatus Acidoferrales bacterium]